MTYNLAGSIPAKVTDTYEQEYKNQKLTLLQGKNNDAEYVKLRKRSFLKYDNFLHSFHQGPHHMKNDLIAEIVANSLHFWTGKSLELICYCIMSNHVHLVMKLFDKEETDSPIHLNKVLQSIKQYSASKANKILQREGQFWQRESYDYQVRDRDERFRIISYILDNPVKAGLCEQRRDWKWSYINPVYDEFIN